MLSLDDTIAAIASPAGGAARGIVRVSGPTTVGIVERCFQPADGADILLDARPARVISGQFNAAGTKLPADVFLWPTNQSYTCRPLAEIHTIASPPLLDAVLQSLCSAGARLARPGEFTLCAFLAGRIDLTQAEAVLGVIDATDRRQLGTALSQLAGGLSRPLHQLRDDLLNLLADLEAGLDFVEEDIRFVSSNELERRLAAGSEQLDGLAQQLSARTASNELPKVALVGWPNVGKSSLFNALVRDPAAIVSPQPGTTRDYLIAQFDAAGLAVELIDTAGVTLELSREQASVRIDGIAQTASIEKHRVADLRLLCLDATRPLNSWEQQSLARENTLVVLTKCDQVQNCGLLNGISPIRTSSHTGFGLNELGIAIRDALASPLNGSCAVAATAVRVGESLSHATESISRARKLVAEQGGDELVAAELRTTLEELGKILGAIYTDDLLDRIFSRFCIGK